MGFHREQGNDIQYVIEMEFTFFTISYFAISAAAEKYMYPCVTIPTLSKSFAGAILADFPEETERNRNWFMLCDVPMSCS